MGILIYIILLYDIHETIKKNINVPSEYPFNI